MKTFILRKPYFNLYPVTVVGLTLTMKLLESLPQHIKKEMSLNKMKLNGSQQQSEGGGKGQAHPVSAIAWQAFSYTNMLSIMQERNKPLRKSPNRNHHVPGLKRF